MNGMSKTPTPGKEEFTVEGACTECMRMGWAVFNDDTEVQRCDVCSVFPNDDAALAYAVRLGAQVLKEVASKDSPRRRTGRRFKEILRAMEVAAEQICPTPWIADPSPEWLRMTVKQLGSLMNGEVTLLAVAYEMQDAGLFCAPSGVETVDEMEEDEVEADREYVRDNLDRDRLEELLRSAGCETFEQGHSFWRVTEAKAS